MSGTVTAGDSWLLTVSAPSSPSPFLPGTSTLRLSCQQRRANVLQRILAVEPEPLSHFGAAGEHDEVPGEQGSQPL